MPLTSGERKQKFIEKLKKDGLYDEYKRKDNDRKKIRNRQIKAGIQKCSQKVQRQIAKKEHRKYIAKKKKKQAEGMQKQILVDKNNFYNTTSALYKAVTKVNNQLPASIDKQVEIINKIYHSFDQGNKERITSNNPKTCEAFETSKKALSKTIVDAVREFYQQDDISRMSPNAKDCKYFINEETGMKEIRQTRHLMFTLSEAYSLFIKEHFANNEAERPPLKLSKFCELRPAHVLLSNKMPRNVCCCIYHANFFECCDALKKITPEFPNYGMELFEFLLCANSADNCWLRHCSVCNSNTINKKVMAFFKGKLRSKATWMKWVKDEVTNRTTKESIEGTVKELTLYFMEIIDKFLIHSYTKRSQATSFKNDASKIETNELLLQIDFAENFKCEAQDEVQSAHWNQTQVYII